MGDPRWEDHKKRKEKEGKKNPHKITTKTNLVTWCSTPKSNHTHQCCGKPEHSQESSGGGEGLVDTAPVVAGLSPHLHILTHDVICESVRDHWLPLLARSDVMAEGRGERKIRR